MKHTQITVSPCRQGVSYIMLGAILGTIGDSADLVETELTDRGLLKDADLLLWSIDLIKETEDFAQGKLLWLRLSENYPRGELLWHDAGFGMSTWPITSLELYEEVSSVNIWIIKEHHISIDNKKWLHTTDKAFGKAFGDALEVKEGEPIESPS